jgi:hypothetical protein
MAPEMTWKTVSDPAQTTEETKIVFDTIGDEFVGTYLGMREVDGGENGRYKQARFAVGDDLYFTNANYSLRNGLKDVRPGTLTRVEFTSEQDTGQASPMRVFTVQVASRKRGVSDNS